MGRLPTSYTAGFETGGRLSATNVPLTPMNAGQEIAQALGSFGHSLEKAGFETLAIEQKEIFREQIAEFKNKLADTQAKLIKKKTELDQDTSISEQSKQKMFDEFAQRQKDDLFYNAPKHIVMDFEAHFKQFTIPLSQQVLVNAEAAIAMRMERAIRGLQIDMPAMVSQVMNIREGGYEARVEALTKALDQREQAIRDAAGPLTGKKAEAVNGAIDNIKKQAYAALGGAIKKESQAQVSMELDAWINNIKGSPQSWSDPAKTADAIKQKYAEVGFQTGMTSLQILDKMQKDVNDVYKNAAQSRLSQGNAIEYTNPLGAIAIYQKVQRAMNAVDDKGQFAYGGTDFNPADRRRIMDEASNQIDKIRTRLEARAARDALNKSSTMSALHMMDDPAATSFYAKTGQSLEKVAPIDPRDMQGSIQRRIALAEQYDLPTPLTKKEAGIIASGVLTAMETGDGITFMNNIKVAAGKRGGAVLGQISKQLTAVNPAAANIVGLVAAGDLPFAKAYADAVKSKRTDSNPVLAADIKARKDRLRKDLDKVNLPNATKEIMIDTTAYVTAGTGARTEDVFREKYGTIENPGWWFSKNPVFIPNGVNQDAVRNFIRSPYALASKVFGVKGGELTGLTVQNVPGGLGLTRDGILQKAKNGRLLVVKWASFMEQQ